MSDVNLAELDWLVAAHWTVLHHATLRPEQVDTMEHESNVEHVWLTCGRFTSVVMIPGVMSRMSLPRCATCCTRRGMPLGKGSPKNDPECRKVLRRQGFIGLDTPDRIDLRDRSADWRAWTNEMREERRRRRSA